MDLHLCFSVPYLPAKAALGGFMLELALLGLVVGGFTWHIIGPDSPEKLKALAARAELAGLNDLEARAILFRDELDQMCFDNCSICGKRSQFASKCEKSHVCWVKDEHWNYLIYRQEMNNG